MTFVSITVFLYNFQVVSLRVNENGLISARDEAVFDLETSRRECQELATAVQVGAQKLTLPSLSLSLFFPSACAPFFSTRRLEVRRLCISYSTCLCHFIKVTPCGIRAVVVNNKQAVSDEANQRIERLEQERVALQADLQVCCCLARG